MAETKGTGGCPSDGKLKRMGSPSSCLSISGISVCAIRLGLRRLEDGRPRDGCPETDAPETDGPETDGPETDATETDGPETDDPETDVPETDGAETEEGGDGGRPRRMSPRRKVCCWWSFSTLWKALVDLPVSLSLMIAVVYVGACFVVGYSFEYSIV